MECPRQCRGHSHSYTHMYSVHTRIDPFNEVGSRISGPFRPRMTGTPDSFKIYFFDTFVVFQCKSKIYLCGKSRVALRDTGADPPVICDLTGSVTL